MLGPSTSLAASGGPLQERSTDNKEEYGGGPMWACPEDFNGDGTAVAQFWVWW